ncbi:MAG: hypothetical protein NVSMB57_05080 [Actinomycetota bacterium]
MWLIVGLIAGALARTVVPGKHRMGFIGTIVLGLVGSVVGGFLAGLIHHSKSRIEPVGIIGSVIGAIIVLLLISLATRRKGVKH